MRPTPFVVLLQEPGSDASSIRQALAECARVQPVSRLSSALARIAGGGVDAVVLDLSSPTREENEKLADFLKLKSEAPAVPIVVVCNSEDDALMRLTTQMGASSSLIMERCRTGLAPVLCGLWDKGHAAASRSRPEERRKRGALISLLGAKGGSGATTVALNAACALAQDRQVILSELCAAPGTLAAHLRIRERIRDLAGFLQQPEASLWRYQRIPGLRILFGPQAPYPERHIDEAQAKVILRAMEPLADFAVADLGAALSEANRTFIESSVCLAVVMERDLVSLEAARKVLRAISGWDAAPQSIGAVVVSRTAVANPVPIAEFESRLEIPVYAAIPPAPDDCLSAQRSGQPLVVFDGEGLAAQSLMSLAELLRQSAGPVHLGNKLVTT